MHTSVPGNQCVYAVLEIKPEYNFLHQGRMKKEKWIVQQENTKKCFKQIVLIFGFWILTCLEFLLPIASPTLLQAFTPFTVSVHSDPCHRPLSWFVTLTSE